MRIVTLRRWRFDAFFHGPWDYRRRLDDHVDTGLVYGLRESWWRNSRGELGGFIASIEFGRWFAVAFGGMRR